MTKAGKAMAIGLLQLLTLLLPPDRRRKLHLLLRFMGKVSANERLVLDPVIRMKTLVSSVFIYRNRFTENYNVTIKLLTRW